MIARRFGRWLFEENREQLGELLSMLLSAGVLAPLVGLGYVAGRCSSPWREILAVPFWLGVAFLAFGEDLLGAWGELRPRVLAFLLRFEHWRFRQRRPARVFTILPAVPVDPAREARAQRIRQAFELAMRRAIEKKRNRWRKEARV